MDRLRPLAANLIARNVGVIAAIGGNNTALVAKTLTTTIPIVFTSGLDPVSAGLVASLNRPEANVTGVSWFTVELAHKHIEVLNELIPGAALIAVLVNPNNAEGGFYEKSAQDGARSLGRRLLFLKAGTVGEIDAAFATLAEQRADAVIVGSGPYYPTRARQLAVLAARYAVPLMSANRDISVAGGLISYGNSVPDASHTAFLGALPAVAGSGDDHAGEVRERNPVIAVVALVDQSDVCMAVTGRSRESGLVPTQCISPCAEYSGAPNSSVAPSYHAPHWPGRSRWRAAACGDGP